MTSLLVLPCKYMITDSLRLLRTGQVKLCDFGVSGELENSVAKTFVGTSVYMSVSGRYLNAFSFNDPSTLRLCDSTLTPVPSSPTARTYTGLRLLCKIGRMESRYHAHRARAWVFPVCG